jgi:hypothetical protein
MSKDTVGKASIELLAKEPDTKDPIELQREMTSEYEKDFYVCVERGKKNHTGDFYVIVVTKKERLMPNVLRLYFMDGFACPTPDYDQTVYKFHRAEERPELIWCIPSRDTCIMFLDNKTAIAPQEWSLLEYVLKFADRTLYKLAKTLNGEVINEHD